MVRKFLFMVGLTIICFFTCILFVPSKSTFAYTSFALASPTPDTTEVVNEAQTLNNIVVIGLSVVGIIFAAISVISGILVYFGISSLNQINKLMQELRDDVEDTRSIRGALVYINLGDRLMERKQVKEALENYQIANDLAKKDPEINYLLGRIYSNAGLYTNAIKALTIATQETPNRSAKNIGEAWRELGMAYRRRGTKMKDRQDIKEAIDCLKKSVVYNSDDDDAHAIIGGLYRREKEFAQALAYYKIASDINPISSYASGNVGSLLWHENEKQEAIIAFETTDKRAQERIKLGLPEGYWDYYDLALAHLMLDKKDVLQCYEDAVNTTPVPKVEVLRGVLDNLYMIRDSALTITSPIPGLSKVIGILENARDS